jgi:hypothetical protein
MMMSDEAAF